MKRRFSEAFTIVELIIVVAVIGILASLALIGYNGVQRGAREKAMLSDIDVVESEMTRYGIAHGGSYSGLSWFSNEGTHPDLAVAPSSGNTIDVVAGKRDYCIRIYNGGTNYNSIETALSKGLTSDSCASMPASLAVGGTWTSNLAGWWRLNGDLKDSSGNNMPGLEAVGAVPATGQGGGANTAYTFNGSSDYIKLGYSSLVGDLTNNLSVSAWINPASVSGARAVLATARLNSANGIGMSMNDASPRFTTYGVKDYDAPLATLSTGSWYFLTAVLADNDVSFYVNGAFVQTVTHTAGANQNLDDVVQLGGNTGNGNSTPGAFFQGLIDDVRIYNEPLSGSEISALYAAGAQ